MLEQCTAIYICMRVDVVTARESLTLYGVGGNAIPNNLNIDIIWLWSVAMVIV